MSSLVRESALGDALEVAPARALAGELAVPGDKSISHRALMLASLAVGHTEIHGLLCGEDVLATRAALVAMGVGITPPVDGHCAVDGVGLHGLVAPLGPLDLGNSGTGMRLLAGILAGQRFPSRLVGDASLSGRPMGRIIEPLRLAGARIDGRRDGERLCPPLVIEASPGLRGIDYATPMASAQVKSCILLAGLYADGATRVREPLPTRDHTERMLRAFGAALTTTEDGAILVPDRPLTSPGRIEVPGDPSSAAFWLVAASVIAGSDLLLRGVGGNPRRTGIVDLLRRMGASIELVVERQVGGEPVADLRVRHARLRGITIGPEEVPGAIDEFPILFVAACFADGVTELRGAAELRAKESDRIRVMVDALRTLGAEVTEHPDGVTIRGVAGLRGGAVDACGDHRCAMALVVAGAASGGARIEDTRPIATSYPGFTADAAKIGIAVAPPA